MVYRIYAEKKAEYAVEAGALLEELRGLAVAGAAEGTAETDEEKNA